MALYYISGVWKDTAGTITHYSFHLAKPEANSFGSLTKKTKAEAIALLETGNSAKTITWNYGAAIWSIGESVTVIGSGANKYIKSNPDHKLTDNLGHLVNWAAIVN